MSVTSHADVIVLNRRPDPRRFPATWCSSASRCGHLAPARSWCATSSRASIPTAADAARLALDRQAGRPDLGGVGRAVTTARATPGRTSSRRWVP